MNGTGLIEINLLPAEYRVVKKQIAVPLGIAYALIGLTVIGAIILILTLNLKTRMVGTDRSIQDLQSKIDENKNVDDQINQLTQTAEEINRKNAALRSIKVNQELWVRLLEDFNKSVPEYTWFTALREDKTTPGKVVIKGRTFSFPQVATLMARLAESKFIQNVDLRSIEQANINERLLYDFELMISLAFPI